MTEYHDPTPKEELERKAVMVLTDAVFRLEKGMVSPECVVATAKAVWHCVSGLVDKEITDLAQRLADETAATPHQKSIYLRNHITASVCRIRYATAKPGFAVRIWNREGPEAGTVKGVDCEDDVDRREKVTTVIQSLIKSGYTLI